jgi:POTRA domain-containing FtsQ-type protein/cell division protein FtsQ
VDLIRRGPLVDPDQPAVQPYLRRSQEERLRRTRGAGRARILLPAALGLVAITGIVGLGYAARWYLMHSSRFKVTKVAVTATPHAPQAELKRIADKARGRNIFALDLSKLRGELEKVRWVKVATLRRVLPDRLMCAVEERVPRGLALFRGRVSLIDEEGAPIDLYTGAGEFADFPIFTGLDDARPERSRLQVSRGFAFLVYLEETHPGFVGEISEIDLSREDRIGLTLNGGGPVVRVHPSDFGSNLDRWLEMRDWLQSHLGSAAYVDLRFHDRIAWQPITTARKN